MRSDSGNGSGRNRQRLPRRRHPVRDERRGERLQNHPLGAIGHRRRQIVVGKPGGEGGKFPTQ